MLAGNLTDIIDMAYGIIYDFEFQDTVLYPGPATWRVRIDKKDYTDSVLYFPFMAENPLTLSRSAEDDSKISPFVGSKAVIRYEYDGTTDTPHPRVFKDIQEDTLLVSIYKDDVLNFRGFVKPDGGQYPLDNPPFTYEINATDYINGLKNKNINIANSGITFYGFISIADFIRRTLFIAANYTGVAVNWLNQIAPDAVAAIDGTLSTKLYFHTDIFLDYDTGPDKIYDALEKFLLSTRSRLIFSAGEYWIQRIPDTYAGADSVEQITVAGTSTRIGKRLFFEISGSSTDEVQYTEGSGIVRTTPAIYSQKAVYKLKAINRLTNFLWIDIDNDFSSVNFGRPLHWNETTATAVGTVVRNGTGSPDDPYYITVSGATPGYAGYMVQSFGTVDSGQYMQLDLKAGIFYSTGLRVQVRITGFVGSVSTYYLSSDGSWSGDSATEILVTGDKKTRSGSLSVTSKVIPDSGGGTLIPVIEFRTVVAANDTEDPVPVGETVHNDIYPPYVRLFSNLIASIETTTVNSNNYSNQPADEDHTFIDLADNNLSNCVYYTDDGGTTYTALPLENWADTDLVDEKSLDEWGGLAIIDQFNVVSNTLEMEVTTNTLEFHHVITTPYVDDGVKLLQLSDDYEVKAGTHKITAEQVYEKGTGSGTYTIKSIPK